MKVLNDEYFRSIDSYFLKKKGTESESETESEITAAHDRSLQTKYHVKKDINKPKQRAKGE
jgi:hypothetical protein